MSVKKRTYTRSGTERTVWRARVWVYSPHGSRSEITKAFPTKRQAEAWEREQRSRVRGRLLDVERTKLADAGLWERAEPVLRSRLAPKTFDHYRRGWNARVLPTLGAVRLGVLSVGDVDRAQATWLAAGAGPSTVRQARLALSAVLAVAVRDGLIPSNPAREAARLVGDVGVRASRRVGRSLTPAQLRQVVDAVRHKAGEPYATMVDLMASAGLRYGEAAGLQCGDIELHRGLIHIERAVVEVARDDGAISAGRRRDGNLVWGPPKNGRARDVPVPHHLLKALASLIDGQYCADLVFRSERGARVIRRNTLARKTDWRNLVAGLGYAGVRLHDLRATAATNLLAAGVPVHVVRDILGHHDLRVTSLYARSHDDALELAAAALSEYSKGA